MYTDPRTDNTLDLISFQKTAMCAQPHDDVTH